MLNNSSMLDGSWSYLKIWVCRPGSIPQHRNPVLQSSACQNTVTDFYEVAEKKSLNVITAIDNYTLCFYL